ncbi:hypothetical protein METHP14_1170007 [Pseudomonas sp. P14-2025]
MNLLKGMLSNCASKLWPKVSAVIPVPSEMKNAVRFICDLGLKLMAILGYDKFGLPNAAVDILPHLQRLFSRYRPQTPGQVIEDRRAPFELFQHS